MVYALLHMTAVTLLYLVRQRCAWLQMHGDRGVAGTCRHRFAHAGSQLTFNQSEDFTHTIHNLCMNILTAKAHRGSAEATCAQNNTGYCYVRTNFNTTIPYTQHSLPSSTRQTLVECPFIE